MRTAIFLGLVMIARAINKDSILDYAGVIATISWVMMVTDVSEWIKNMSKEK